MTERSNGTIHQDRRVGNRRIITTPEYTGPERRSTERRDASELQDPK